MDSDRIQIIERLKQSTNVLVTVNNNPTVDQLAACIGVTLLLNKLGKHATAVFSGAVPSTIEFLKPEETLEKNTDSLRDFIIALDKAKADKLRYKVEDTMVKIFITPYKTSISDKDLEFSQGDFNVDVVLAIGIHDKEQVDQAIMAHGRILHDAIVMSVNNQQGNVIGSINWVEDQASSLCEMLTSIADDLQQQSLDEQISTAFLTGIVAETERFRNEKTTSVTMSMSSKLMAAGANQQLVATELEPEPEPAPEPELIVEQVEVPAEPAAAPEEEKHEDEGAIIIDHPEDKPPEPPTEPELPPIDPNEIDIDTEGTLRKATDVAETEQSAAESTEDNSQANTSTEPISSKLVIEPPTMGGTLTANSRPEQLDPTVDPLSVNTQTQPILSHSDGAGSDDEKKIEDNQTLEQIEEAVHASEQTVESAEAASSAPDPQQYPTSYFDTPAQDNISPSPVNPVIEPVPVVEQNNTSTTDTPVVDADDARDAVQDAINMAAAEGTQPPEPMAAVGATPIDLNMGHDDPVQPESSTAQPQFPPNLVPPNPGMPAENTASSVEQPESPPPVPPPMMPPFDSSSTTSPQ